MVTRTGGLHRHYPLPLSVSRKGLSDTLQCKERDSQRMAGSAYFVPSGRKTWPFRQNIREMYPSTAFFQPKAYKMRPSRQNRLSEGTFQRDLARKPPSGCARAQNVLFLPRRRKDWSIPASNWPARLTTSTPDRERAIRPPERTDSSLRFHHHPHRLDTDSGLRRAHDRSIAPSNRILDQACGSPPHARGATRP